jgi:hypothetical protein
MPAVSLTFFARFIALFVDLLQSKSTYCAQAIPRLLDPAKEAQIMLEALFEPVLLRFKTDQNGRACRDG